MPAIHVVRNREDGEKCHSQSERVKPEADQEAASSPSSSIFSETPASAKVAMSERHLAAASTMCIESAAPEPSPSRMPRSNRGSRPM